MSAFPKAISPEVGELQAVAELLDVAPQDVAPQDVAPQDVAPQDVAPQDVAPQDVAPQDVAPQDVAPQDVAPQDVAPQDVAPQDVAPQDVALSVQCSSAYVSNIFLFFLSFWARREWTLMPETLRVRVHTLQCIHHRITLCQKPVQWSSWQAEESVELQGLAQQAAVCSQLMAP